MATDRSAGRSGTALGRPRPAALTVLTTLTAVLWLAWAGVAYADPARPTHYRSQVTGLDPATDAVTVQVIGGDAFLRIAVQPGHTATVYGYRDEPYLRIDDDGTVQANLNSPAYYLNQDRYANVSPPDRADPEAQPDWTTVATGGSYAWHDHRIHWMSPDAPRSIRPAQGVQPVTEVSPWQVPITVDGTDTTIRGELVWVPTANPTLPVIVGLLAAAAGWAAARRTSGTETALAAAAGAAITVSIGEAAIQPEGLAAGWTNWGPPALALLLAVGATATGTARRTRDLTILSGLVILIWVVRHLSTLWLPVLPSLLDDTLARTLTAAAAGLLAGVTLRRLKATVADITSDDQPPRTST